MELSPATGDFRPYGIQTACPSVCGNSARSGIPVRACSTGLFLQPLFVDSYRFQDGLKGRTDLDRQATVLAEVGKLFVACAVPPEDVWTYRSGGIGVSQGREAGHSVKRIDDGGIFDDVPDNLVPVRDTHKPPELLLNGLTCEFCGQAGKKQGSACSVNRLTEKGIEGTASGCGEGFELFGLQRAEVFEALPSEGFPASELVRIVMVEDGNGFGEVQGKHLDDARRDLPMWVAFDPWDARFVIKAREGPLRYLWGCHDVEGIRGFEARHDTLKVVADRAPPLGLRLLMTSGSYVPEAKLPPRVIDSMTSVDLDLEPHLGEDFPRNGPEFICLGTREECQVGIAYLCFRRFPVEDTHKFAFVGTIDGCQPAMAVPGAIDTSTPPHAEHDSVAIRLESIAATRAPEIYSNASAGCTQPRKSMSALDR